MKLCERKLIRMMGLSDQNKSPNMFYGDKVWDNGTIYQLFYSRVTTTEFIVTLLYKGDPIHGNISKTRREISVTGQRHKMKST